MRVRAKQGCTKYPRDSGYATHFVYFWRFRLGLRSGVPELGHTLRRAGIYMGKILKHMSFPKAFLHVMHLKYYFI